MIVKSSMIQTLGAACCVVLTGIAGGCGGDDGTTMNGLSAGATGGLAAGSGGLAGRAATGAAGGPLMPMTPGAAGRGAAGMTAAATAGRAPATAGSPGAAGMTAGRAGATAGAGTGTAGASGMSGTAGMVATTAGGGAAGRAGMGGMTAAGSGGGSAGAAGGGTGTTATFTEIYGLIMMGCSCHVTSTMGGLSMSSKAVAYTNLVGATATACPGEKRVVAGDPDKSVLYHSLDRTTFGSCKAPQMPAGGAKWSQANLDKLKSWITAGAMNN